jgi:bifunctional UDP-N-acetylglucosamine pyrophosphorylase/glucosamine-1-phosphate N-acetyltransferase
VNIEAIVLAAGKGTRMKSELLKVAHEVAGKSIVSYVVDAVNESGASKIYVVIGHQAETVKKKVTNPKCHFVMQEKQLGTGHAVQQVASHYKGHDDSIILILAGDCPLIKSSTLKEVIDSHKESNAAATIVTTKMKDPANYGRILRGKMGTVLGIKEAKDCSEKERLISEVNTGVYAFRAKDLFQHLNVLKTNNNQGEYYLTDIIHILKQKGEVVESYLLKCSDQAIGINTRQDLAKTNQILYQENNKTFMEEGVTILDPSSTFIDSGVTIGRDTIIGPFVQISGETRIGRKCTINAHCYLKDTVIKENTTLPPFSCMTNNKK